MATQQTPQFSTEEGDTEAPLLPAQQPSQIVNTLADLKLAELPSLTERGD